MQIHGYDFSTSGGKLHKDYQGFAGVRLACDEGRGRMGVERLASACARIKDDALLVAAAVIYSAVALGVMVGVAFLME